MKAAGKFLGKYIALFITVTIAATLLLVAVYWLPVDMGKRERAYAVIEKEGWYPRALISAVEDTNNFGSYFSDVLDGSSDRIMIETALEIFGGGGALRQAMASHSNYAGDYSYYWHGYVILLRPLFLLFDLTEIRELNSFCQIAIVFILSWMVGRIKGFRYVLLLVSSYLLLMPSALACSFQFSWVFYIAYIGSILLLWKQSFFVKGIRYLYFFLVIGMLTSYFDLLTYPLVTWGVPLMWMLIVDEDSHQEWNYLKKVIFSGISWIVGYGLFWTMKWVLATWVLGEDIIQLAWDEVFVRTGNGEELYMFYDRMEAVYRNWRHYGEKGFLIVLVIWFVWWIYRTLRQGQMQVIRKRYAFFLVGLSSLVWYLVLGNHTLIHHFFTYRIFAVSVMAFLALILESSQSNEKNISVKQRFRMLMYWCVAGLFSLLMMLLIPMEESRKMNGMVSFQEPIVWDGTGLIEEKFIPTQNVVSMIAFGLQSESVEGEYQITLWQENEKKEVQTVALGELKGENYHEIKVLWKVKAGENYRITFEVTGNELPIYVWVTANGAYPLAEYGEAMIGGQPTSGQMLSGISYREISDSKSVQVLLVVGWATLLVGALYTFLGRYLFPNAKK